MAKQVRWIKLRKRECRARHRGADSDRDGPVTPERCAAIAELMAHRAEAYEMLGFSKLAEECRAFGVKALEKLGELRDGRPGGGVAAAAGEGGDAPGGSEERGGPPPPRRHGRGPEDRGRLLAAGADEPPRLPVGLDPAAD